MVRAWYKDESLDDQRLEHRRSASEFLELDKLFQLTGVEYFKVDHDNCENDDTLKKVKNERGYLFNDQIICSKEYTPDYEATLKNLFTEHLHVAEEIILATEGSGYFDVRDGKNKWIRIELAVGDAIIIPGGLYHRFTPDVNEFFKANRYFVTESVMIAYIRFTDEMVCRKDYLKRLNNGFQIATN